MAARPSAAAATISHQSPASMWRGRATESVLEGEGEARIRPAVADLVKRFVEDRTRRTRARSHDE